MAATAIFICLLKNSVNLEQIMNRFAKKVKADLRGAAEQSQPS
jgi:hypothetical protein